MFPLPIGFHGSKISSVPKDTLHPASVNSLTRVNPRRLGYVSARPPKCTFTQGLATKLIFDIFKIRIKRIIYALLYECIAVV